MPCALSRVVVDRGRVGSRCCCVVAKVSMDALLKYLCVLVLLVVGLLRSSVSKLRCDRIPSPGVVRRRHLEFVARVVLRRGCSRVGGVG